MKIISYNIGIKIDNSAQVKEYLKAQDADIVCLQEVVRPLDASVYPIYRSEDEIRNFLKDKYPYYFFAPEWVADKFVKSMGVVDRDLGGMVEQGKLVLSKYPIVHGYDYFYYKDYELDCDRSKFHEGNDHGRALQVVEIDIDGAIIQIGNVHGSYSREKTDTEKSLFQNELIIKKLKEKKLPTILLGDFNVSPDTKSIAMINKEYINLNEKNAISSTCPNNGPEDGRAIDYVFVSEEWKSGLLKVDITDISDHYPLIAELQLSQNHPSA